MRTNEDQSHFVSIPLDIQRMNQGKLATLKGAGFVAENRLIVKRDHITVLNGGWAKVTVRGPGIEPMTFKWRRRGMRGNDVVIPAFDVTTKARVNLKPQVERPNAKPQAENQSLKTALSQLLDNNGKPLKGAPLNNKLKALLAQANG